MDKLLKEMKDHPILYCPESAVPAMLKHLLATEEGTEVLVKFVKKVAAITALYEPIKQAA